MKSAHRRALLLAKKVENYNKTEHGPRNDENAHIMSDCLGKFDEILYDVGGSVVI